MAAPYFMRLEVVPLPVSDVDRAKAFYVEQVGFWVDHDVQVSEGVRVVQLTPPGSRCSVVFGNGLREISGMKPGSVKGLHLVVDDIRLVQSHLRIRGVTVSELVEFPGGVLYASFSDPDGNTWTLQQIS